MRPEADESDEDNSLARLSPEAQAARLLHAWERGGWTVQGLARAAGLPFALCERLLRRAVATLAARGYSEQWICENFRLTHAQLMCRESAAVWPAIRAIGQLVALAFTAASAERR